MKKINFGKNDRNYPDNFCTGDGSYLIAVVNYKLVASLKINSAIGVSVGKYFDLFRKQIEKKFNQAEITIIEADYLRLFFFARHKECIFDRWVRFKLHTLPSPMGGEVEFMQLVFE